MSDFKIVQLLNPIQINVNVNPTGAYDNGTTYAVGDIVSYGNSSYIAIQATTGNLPTDPTYWQLLASANTNKLGTVARNTTGSTIPAASVVYFSGVSGNLPTLALSQADTELGSTGTIGITAAAIANNANGEVVVFGLADNLDTTAFTAGSALWLSPTVAGGMTMTKPSAPDHMVLIGFVTRSHPTNGTLEVKIENGFELEELHDVAISSVANNQALVYESATSLWKNHTLVKSDVGLSNVDNTSDATKDAAVATLTNKTLTSPVINSPTGIVKADVGLSNVDNTSDLNKPVSTATQTALNLKENSSNKTTNFTGNTGSNTLFPTVKAIFDALVGYLAGYQPLLGYTPANETLSNLPSTSIGTDLLPDTDGIYNIGASGQNWNNIRAKTIGYDGGTAINLDSKKMFDGAVEESIDFEARILKDTASVGSVQYGTRALLDSLGSESVNWESRYLADDGEVLALDYIDRRLFASDGTTPVLDWSSATGASATTQSPGNNSTKIATTAYVDNIAPTWEEFFGGGILGNLTLTGALTITEDVFYDTLTLNAGAALNTNGFKIFCKTLDLSNAPASAIRRFGNNGNNAANQTGGGTQAGLNAGTTGGGGQGGAGATGTTGVGAQAVAAGGFVNANGGNSGAGGQGGAGTPNAGGASRAASTATTGLDFDRIAFDLLRGQVLIGGGAGGPGGSAGGGDGTNLGRGGGGGGASGGVIAIYAHTIITSGSTASSAIACNGGNGGLGASATVGNIGGGGGGAGAGGGYIYILYANKTGPVVTNLLNASGGNGGNGGNGFGTGTGARGGGGGTGGRIQLLNISTGVGQKTLGSAGVAGGLNSGLTGGTGGAAGACNVSF